MISLKDSRISDILPEYLAYGPEMEALSYAVSQEIIKLLSYCDNIGVYSMMERLQEDMLDMLALEINTPYYDENLEIGKKRELVKNTLQWHEKAGTPATVEELVKTVFGEGRVREWYQYGGEPYHFKIETTKTPTDEMYRYFLEIMRSVKNTRSYFDSIGVYRTIAGSFGYGIVHHAVFRNAVICENNINREVL